MPEIICKCCGTENGYMKRQGPWWWLCLDCIWSELVAARETIKVLERKVGTLHRTLDGAAEGVG